MKICSRCHNLKSLEEFHRDRSSSDGRGHRCKDCDKVKQRADYEKNGDRIREWQRTYEKEWRKNHPEASKDRWFRTTYGLTTTYQELLDSQDGKCGICGVGPGDTRFHVDHDHSCCPGRRSCGMCIRGLLCRTCNVGVGGLQDDIKLLYAAIAYLQR